MSRRAVLFAAFAALLSGPASAAETPYTVKIGANEQLTGIVTLDDSSGEVVSVKGVASGAVNGAYTLDGVTTHAEIAGTGLKLDVSLDRRSAQLRARLDTCPTGQDACTAGDWVTLWEQ